MGNSVCGPEADVLLGCPVPLLGCSVPLQPKETQIKSSKTTSCGFRVLNIILEIIIANSRFVFFARKLFARHSILTFDPTAEVNELATLRTEWTKGIVFPLGRFTAGWTLHES